VWVPGARGAVRTYETRAATSRSQSGGRVLAVRGAVSEEAAAAMGGR
jgi:hypothetical protein